MTWRIIGGASLVIGGVEDPRKTAALCDAGAEVVFVESDGPHFDLRRVLRLLAERQINEVLLESGANLAGAMLSAGLIDELTVYLAPHIMGDGGKGLFNLPRLSLMADRHQLRFNEVTRVGRDIRITAAPIPKD